MAFFPVNASRLAHLIPPRVSTAHLFPVRVGEDHTLVAAVFPLAATISTDLGAGRCRARLQPRYPRPPRGTNDRTDGGPQVAWHHFEHDTAVSVIQGQPHRCAGRTAGRRAGWDSRHSHHLVV